MKITRCITHLVPLSNGVAEWRAVIALEGGKRS